MELQGKKYDYSLKLSRVAIDPAAEYGYWERALVAACEAAK